MCAESAALGQECLSCMAPTSFHHASSSRAQPRSAVGHGNFFEGIKLRFIKKNKTLNQCHAEKMPNM